MITFKEFIELQKEGQNHEQVPRSKRQLLLERKLGVSSDINERTSLAVDRPYSLSNIPLL